MTKEETLYSFWSSFGLTAYEENSTPNQPKFPYLTYQVSTDSFDNEIPLTASLWDKTTNWAYLNVKTSEINQTIGRGGIFLDCDEGKIWIKRGTPFAHNMGDESDNLIKRKYINITAEFFTAD